MSIAKVESLFLSRKARRRTAQPAQADQPRFIELDRATVRYRLQGSAKPVLVLVPDPPNTIEHYRALQARLAGDFTVLCFEAVGFGFSYPRRGFGFTLDEQAAVLIDLLTALELTDCTLAISCLGAFAGLVAAAARPDLIARLVLMQVPSYEEARRWSRIEDLWGIIRTPVVGQAFMLAAKNQVARQWYSSALPEGADVAPFLEPTLEALKNGACFCLASAYQTFQRGPFQLAAPIRQPTLALWGAADRTHADTQRRSILEHVPHAEFLEYQGCGHFPDLEAPEAYAQLVRSFVHTRCSAA